MHLSIIIAFIASLLSTSIPASSATRSRGFDLRPRNLYVALQSRGIATLQFDPSKNATSSLTVLETTAAGFQPGWLHCRGDRLYSISREQYPNISDTSGGTFSFSTNFRGPKTASHEDGLKFMNSVSSNGEGGVYIDISPDGHTLSAANIDGSTISIHPLHRGGTIQNATQIFHYNLTTPGPGAGDSQIQSNPHQAIFDPSGQYLFSPDRGADLLRIYNLVEPNHAHNPSTFELYQTIRLEPGTGPRHIAFRVFNATRTFMYLVSELDNTIRVFALDGLRNDHGPHAEEILEPHLELTFEQIISTLGLADQRTLPTNEKLASELAITTDSKFLYASNRNTDRKNPLPDDIAIFSVNASSTDGNHLTFLGRNSTMGKIPRNFALSGRSLRDRGGDSDCGGEVGDEWVAVANQATQNLVIFERNSGFLGDVRGTIAFGELDGTLTMGPMAVVWDG